MQSRSGLATSESAHDQLGHTRLRHRSEPSRQGRWALSIASPDGECALERRYRHISLIAEFPKGAC
jgi:hypothetical protein